MVSFSIFLFFFQFSSLGYGKIVALDVETFYKGLSLVSNLNTFYSSHEIHVDQKMLQKLGNL